MRRIDPNRATPSCYVLVGPTAVGKSAVAHCLAETYDVDLLSADSMQVYRGMDIGTAKPTAAEREALRYGGIDLVNPDTPFSVRDFQLHALRFAAETRRRDRDLIVVGGTGLYVKCLTQGLDSGPPPDEELRGAWAESAATDVAALQERLRELDEAAYEGLDDKENPRRLIRAIERAGRGGGSPAQSWERVSQPTLVGLSRPVPALSSRIEARVNEMYGQGLLDEVRGLKGLYTRLSRTAEQAIGYAEALLVLAGEMDVAQAKERTVVRTRRLAKKQRTWFRHQAVVEWVKVEEYATERDVAAAVVEAWRKHGPAELVS